MAAKIYAGHKNDKLNSTVQITNFTGQIAENGKNVKLIGFKCPLS